MSFELMNVRPEIIRSLKELGIEKPTDIQKKAIPLIKSGKDVIGSSKTGSGKTVAFGVPVLEKTVPRQGIQALIIAPTRELAVQISHELSKFGKHIGFHIATVYGGVSISPQIDSIAKAEIIVGTPGRLLDHLQRGTLNLSKLKCVVLDEADKMVEMGFIEDIRRILDNTPRNRQMLLFGATISDEIDELKHRYMNNPVTAKTESRVEDDFLEQYYYDVEAHDKFSLLVHLLRKEQTKQVIIFCSKRSTVEILAKNLRMQGVKAEMIHGKLSQNRRLSVIENFNKGSPDIIVASPVAARGLDIKNVTHVINYDLSQDSQEYIHRIGRTARAGESGKAITLLSQRDYDVFSNILVRHDMKVEKLPKEDFQKLPFRIMQKSSRFGNNSFGRSNRSHGYHGHQRGSFSSNRGSRFGQRAWNAS